jgi:hypothetical protein
MSYTENMSKKRGRPKKNIKWPDQDFTSSDIKNGSSESLSDGLIHIKLQEAIKNQEVVIVGKIKQPKKGRPRLVYRKNI